jgi:hypothetical protein
MKGLFSLLAVRVMRFDGTGSEGQIARAPIAAPVFNDLDGMADAV